MTDLSALFPSLYHGDMVNNLGSAGALTMYGTINVGKGGNYV